MAKRFDFRHHDIPTKANRILNVILIAMLLIVIRIWHLSVVQYDSRLEQSRKPQNRVVLEPARRGTIRDCFNIPLAINKIHYQAAVLYSQIKDIPATIWKTDALGKPFKVAKRKEYIQQLSALLAQELDLDAERIEDLIHAKASYAGQMPFVLKEEISEKAYYRLKMLEKDWPGLFVRPVPKRCYPRGKVAADIIGYMGAINQQEYESILNEMKALDTALSQSEAAAGLEEWPEGIRSAEDAKKRLQDLQEKAYSIQDSVGKMGIETIFEENLRGFYGKKTFYSDSRGNYLRELPGSRPPLSGNRYILTLSAELQEYAEQLLAQNEQVRAVRVSSPTTKHTTISAKHPWIKGGAIVAMEPQTGNIVALASFPRFDPNDFIATGDAAIDKEKKARIHRWFEDETHLAAVWNQQRPLERESYVIPHKQIEDEQRLMTWEAYLDIILPQSGDLRKAMKRISTLKQAVQIQQCVDTLAAAIASQSIYPLFNALYPEGAQYPPQTASAKEPALTAAFDSHKELVTETRKQLKPYFEGLTQNYDKVLLVDLCRVGVGADQFSSKLVASVGSQLLVSYREASGVLVALMPIVKGITKELFHDRDFKEWRKKEEKAFLKQVRADEKASKSYAKPYIDYLDRQEAVLLEDFWNKYKWKLLVAFLAGHSLETETQEEAPYLAYFRHWHQELQQGAHKEIEWRRAYNIMQVSVKGLSTPLAIEYLQSLRSYQDLERPLLGRYRGLRKNKDQREKHLAAAFYPPYGYGCARSYAYRQACVQGSIFKLVTAYEALIQRYQRLGQPNISELALNPLVIVDDVYQLKGVQHVGYTKEGVPIPQLYKGGRLPRSLAHKHNGEVDLVRAMDLSSNPYFSLLAGECIDHPEDLSKAARLFSFGARTGIELPAELKGLVPDDLATNRNGLYAMAIGQHSLVVTPLQTAVMLSAIANGGKVLKPKIVQLTAGREPARDLGKDAKAIPYHQYSAEVVRELPMPLRIREMLLKGLKASTARAQAEAAAGGLAKLYQDFPEAVQAFKELGNQFVGKSSTAEALETIDLDLNEGTNIYTHVWFGSIAFDRQGEKVPFEKPELVVVIFLRYGGYGKEGAPLAAQIVQKWRELKKKHAANGVI